MLKELNATDICNVSPHNKLNILRCFLSGKEISRKEVAEECGLSEATAGKISAALCKLDLLRSEKRPVGRGRHTEFFVPTDKLCALVMIIKDGEASATLFDLCGNVVFELCRTGNPALDCTSAVKDICTELSLFLESAEKKRIFKTVLLLESGLSLCIKESIEAVISDCFEIEASLEYKRARASAMGRLYPNEVLFVVGVNEALSFNLMCANRLLPKRESHFVHTASNDPNELVDEISALVSPIFSVAIPDRIVIESHTLLVDRAFREALCENIARATGIPKEELPKIESNANADYAELEALYIVREKICEEFVRESCC